MAERRLVDGIEEGRQLERLAPGVVAKARLAVVRFVDDLVEGPDPAVRRIAGLPDEAQSAVGLEDAANLARGADPVEPVKRLAHDDGIDGVVLEA